MRRLVAMLCLTAAVFGLLTSTAAAAPSNKLDDDLAALWTKILQTPSDQNAFGSGGAAFACWDIGGTVAPFTPAPEGVASCTVKPGTKVFVVAASTECSTFPGDCQDPPPTPAQLPGLAHSLDAQSATPTVTVDGKSQTVTEVQTGLRKIVLPDGNLFEQPAGTTGQFAADGWVTLLNPLTPGTHLISIHSDNHNIHTSIIVRPGA